MDHYNELFQIAADFRRGIEQAKDAGEFDGDISFTTFPRRCCGDTCYLLGHYLLERGIQTYYVGGSYGQWDSENYQSHAWLKTEDGIIIDITGDQFRCNSQLHNYDIPVYVGIVDAFHDLFDVQKRDVWISVTLDRISCLDDNRYPNLYKSIVKYI